MEIEMIDRVMKNSVIAGVVVSFAAACWYGIEGGAAVLAGTVWGIANLYMIKMLVLSAFNRDGVNYLRLILAIVIKFPLIYLAGFILLMFLPYEGLVVGFTLLLVVMIFTLMLQPVFVRQTVSKREVD